MAEARSRGQEIEIKVLVDGALSDAFPAIKVFNETTKFERSDEGYLGETTNRVDTIFNGHEGSLEMHLSNQRWMEFQALVKAKAKRLNSQLVFNIVETTFYDNGDTPTRTFMDVAWGPQPRSVSSRADFVSISMDFGCSEVDDNLDGFI